MKKLAIISVLFVCVLTILTLGVAGKASALSILTDDFNRANNDTVGNGWSETERNSNDVTIIGNILQLRDYTSGDPVGRGAAVVREISLLGLENISLGFDWSAHGNTEAKDKFYVGWNVGAGWNVAWSQALGGSAFAPVSLDLSSDVDNQAGFKLAFWTKLVGTQREEAAYIDNIVLRGDEIVLASAVETGPAPDIIANPEPGTILLLGAGLLGLVGFGRKKLKK